MIKASDCSRFYKMLIQPKICREGEGERTASRGCEEAKS